MAVEHARYERNCLLRSLGNIAQVPDVAIAELVANAWDAGASRVDIEIPPEIGGTISVNDDGIGMTATQFVERWMCHGYLRIDHQGRMAEFPESRKNWTRRAYGRNGLGRHGLLCFSDRYTVETRRDQHEEGFRFIIVPASGDSAFDMISKEEIALPMHGTRVSATVERNLPVADSLRESLSFKFLHDPQFTIYLNGDPISLEMHRPVAEETIQIDEDTSVQVVCVEMPHTKHRKAPHGVAFWIGNRLVGDPTYSLHGQQLLDGRTSIANRHMIVVKSNDLFEDVQPDWSGFRKTQRTYALAEDVGAYVNKLVAKLMEGKIEENKKEALRENSDGLRKLKPLAQIEVSEFVDELVTDHPTLNVDILTSAVKAAVNLEKSRSGQALLEKLATISEDDADLMNSLLSNWTLRDALAVLEELDRRMSTIKALEKLIDDPNADELHTIHPLVTQARWLFGPEFESPAFSSNISIKNAAAKVFKKKIDPKGIANPRQRPDLIFCRDATFSLTGTEEFDDGGAIFRMSNLLVIELKRGNFTITSSEIAQAVQYVQDLLNCGILDGPPYIRAFVVGSKKDSRCRTQLIGVEPTEGKVEATTFGQLVRTGEHRLFNLQKRIAERYDQIPGLELVNRVLGQPQQKSLFENNKKARKRPTKKGT